MRLKSSIIFLCALTFLTSCCCWEVDHRKSLVADRASIDLNCPAENINVAELSHNAANQNAQGPVTYTYIADGCQKKAVYDNVGERVEPTVQPRITSIAK